MSASLIAAVTMSCSEQLAVRSFTVAATTIAVAPIGALTSHGALAAHGSADPSASVTKTAFDAVSSVIQSAHELQSTASVVVAESPPSLGTSVVLWQASALHTLVHSPSTPRVLGGHGSHLV